ncbi:ABC transporter ATP-binding protein [Lysinibacillus sp. OL1_EC]|uniref:ABC transporter ATP-binding protein n=1 Tax=unclassified Lysinibacillus TaxID=2636778 RepID=UPI00103D20F4|nr:MULTISPECIES: ABC transporter ATP-binding protein [unclassified Lysinibacillus]MCM0624887.1 ABC transporter ATP-binding protein [Lysinibacillus sp. OL1_EC]MCS5502594.1 ABC transporter ATP-binding protein [Lysinibacillus sp. A4]TBV87701.1 ABC transporter ATP-binding protein [Lysinibacillus sp. OL1]UKJ45187.1 ABC transporter ATP-binding protein [Lysinibacillus sp. ACHW1.5]WGT40302.1 ABC transporter ATP-binding protein [Lysinibacillus sp. 1 U-2021]
MNVIEIKNVSREIEGRKILKDINLDIKKGEIIAILGHNGAGKTTLVNTVMKLVRHSGAIEYSFNEKELYKKIAYQMQTSSYEDEAKVLEVCLLYKQVLQSKIDIQELLREFDLDKFQHSYIKNLSGGQKQSLSILLTLIGEPEVLIFDELTTGLDSLKRRNIWDTIKKINKYSGTTIILTSHFLDEVEYLADRVVIMNQGKIEQIGTVFDIVNVQFKDTKKMEFETVFLENLEIIFERKVKVSNNKVSFTYRSNEEEDIYKKVKKIAGTNIVMKNFSFEDAFLQMLGYKLVNGGEILND